MKAELLYKIADIINSNSSTHHAVVPCSRHDYMVQEGNRLVKSSCLVLRIMLSGKVKNHVTRSFWNIYEKDIDKVIMKLCRRDRAFAERVAQRALTAQGYHEDLSSRQQLCRAHLKVRTYRPGCGSAHTSCILQFPQIEDWQQRLLPLRGR